MEQSDEGSLGHHSLPSRELSAAAEAHNILRAACRTPPLIVALGYAPSDPLMPHYSFLFAPPKCELRAGDGHHTARFALLCNG
jgi:hypothetical protein